MTARIKRLNEIEAKFKAGDEAKQLPQLPTAELLGKYQNDQAWLKHPTDLEIDGFILARSRAIGEILKMRGCYFYDGTFNISPPNVRDHRAGRCDVAKQKRS